MLQSVRLFSILNMILNIVGIIQNLTSLKSEILNQHATFQLVHPTVSFLIITKNVMFPQTTMVRNAYTNYYESQIVLIARLYTHVHVCLIAIWTKIFPDTSVDSNLHHKGLCTEKILNV